MLQAPCLRSAIAKDWRKMILENCSSQKAVRGASQKTKKGETGCPFSRTKDLVRNFYLREDISRDQGLGEKFLSQGGHFKSAAIQALCYKERTRIRDAADIEASPQPVQGIKSLCESGLHLLHKTEDRKCPQNICHLPWYMPVCVLRECKTQSVGHQQSHHKTRPGPQSQARRWEECGEDAAVWKGRRLDVSQTTVRTRKVPAMRWPWKNIAGTLSAIAECQPHHFTVKVGQWRCRQRTGGEEWTRPKTFEGAGGRCCDPFKERLICQTSVHSALAAPPVPPSSRRSWQWAKSWSSWTSRRMSRYGNKDRGIELYI